MRKNKTLLATTVSILGVSALLLTGCQVQTNSNSALSAAGTCSEQCGRLRSSAQTELQLQATELQRSFDQLQTVVNGDSSRPVPPATQAALTELQTELAAQNDAVNDARLATDLDFPSLLINAQALQDAVGQDLAALRNTLAPELGLDLRVKADADSALSGKTADLQGLASAALDLHTKAKDFSAVANLTADAKANVDALQGRLVLLDKLIKKRLNPDLDVNSLIQLDADLQAHLQGLNKAVVDAKATLGAQADTVLPSQNLLDQTAKVEALLKASVDAAKKTPATAPTPSGATLNANINAEVNTRPATPAPSVPATPSTPLMPSPRVEVNVNAGATTAPTTGGLNVNASVTTPSVTVPSVNLAPSAPEAPSVPSTPSIPTPSVTVPGVNVEVDASLGGLLQ